MYGIGGSSSCHFFSNKLNEDVEKSKKVDKQKNIGYKMT